MSNEHISQKLSQKLWDAGFRGEHVTVWFKGKVRWYKGSKLAWAKSPNHTSYPAYTFSELWGVLPQVLDKPLCTYYLTLHKVHQGTIALYEHPTIGHLWKREPHESPAEACGLLLEWLITEGHMEVAG